MNKLSKEKRNQLTLIILCIVLALSGLWFGLVKSQMDGLHSLNAKRLAARQKLTEMENTINNSQRLDAELVEANRKLTKVEDGMASGDKYAWMINTIGQFKLPHQVNIPQFSTIVEADMSMYPKFPYKQVTMTISGTAYYHDLGRFIADFENHFPYMRVQNLDIEPAQASTPAEADKLTFKMDIVSLVKPDVS